MEAWEQSESEIWLKLDSILRDDSFVNMGWMGSFDKSFENVTIEIVHFGRADCLNNYILF